MANDIDWTKVSRALKEKAGKMQDHANAVSVGSKDENRANALDAGAAVLRAIAEALDFGALHEEDR